MLSQSVHLLGSAQARKLTLCRLGLLHPPRPARSRERRVAAQPVCVRGKCDSALYHAGTPAWTEVSEMMMQAQCLGSGSTASLASFASMSSSKSCMVQLAT